MYSFISGLRITRNVTDENVNRYTAHKFDFFFFVVVLQVLRTRHEKIASLPYLPRYVYISTSRFPHLCISVCTLGRRIAAPPNINNAQRQDADIYFQAIEDSRINAACIWPAELRRGMLGEGASVHYLYISLILTLYPPSLILFLHFPSFALPYPSIHSFFLCSS